MRVTHFPSFQTSPLTSFLSTCSTSVRHCYKLRPFGKGQRTFIHTFFPRLDHWGTHVSVISFQNISQIGLLAPFFLAPIRTSHYPNPHFSSVPFTSPWVPSTEMLFHGKPFFSPKPIWKAHKKADTNNLSLIHDQWPPRKIKTNYLTNQWNKY